MPRINKVRLVNFRWSTQRIDDLLLDFHGGQNTELRLENGGGKSVLERLIYQSVWPGTKVSDNPVIDYIGDKPATVAVEWLLDTARNEEPDYLTSGVVLSRNTGPEEDKATVNYLMFTSHNDHLNVHQLPYISSSIDGKRITIQSFKETRDVLNSLERKYPEIRVYARKEAKAYRQTLKSFGISPENWNQLILQLISGEDPFKDVLGRTKTSDSLLNLYIIPKIDSHLDQISSDATKIRNNMNHVVSDSARFSQMINRRDAIAEYLEQVPSVKESLSTIVDVVTQRETDLKNLSSFAYSVHLLEQKCGEELNENVEKQNALNQEKEQIRLEQASQIWYQKKEELTQAEQNENEGKEKYDASSRRYDDISLKQNILQAARSYQKIQKHNAQISEYQIQLQGLSETEESRHVASLRYSIHLAYEQAMKSLQETITSLQTVEENCNKKLTENHDQSVALNNEQKQKEQERNDLSVRNQIMDREFDHLWDDLDAGFRPGRGFTGELIHEDLLQMEKILDERIQRVSDAIAADQNRISEISSEIPHLEKDSSAVMDRIYEIQTKQKENTEEQERYQKNLETLREIFRKTGMDEQYLFHQERGAVLEEKIQNNDTDIADLTYEVRGIRHLIDAVKKGETYLPDAFSDFLEHHQIQYQSGEDFLRSQDDADQYVQKFPLLPYGVILDPSDYTKLKNLNDNDLFLDRMIPVYLYEDLNQDQSLSYDGSVLKSADQKFYLHMEESLLHAKTKEAFIQHKEEEEKRKSSRLASLETKKEDLLKAKQIFSDFPASADALSELRTEAENLETELVQTKNQLEQIQKELQSLRTEQRETDHHLHTSETELATSKNQKETYQKQIAKDAEYVRNTNSLADVNEILKQIEAKQEKLQEEKKKTETERLNAHLKKSDVDNRLAEMKKNSSRFLDAKEAPVIEDTLDSLLNAYEIASDSLSRNEQDLRDKLDQTYKERDSEEQYLQSLNLKEEQYQNQTFRQEEFNECQRQAQEEKEEKERLQNRLNELSVIKGRKESAFRQAKETLLKCGAEQPLERQAIKGNFEERTRLTEEKISSLQKDQKRLEERRSEAVQAYEVLDSSGLLLPDSDTKMDLEEDLKAQRIRLYKTYQDRNNEVKDQLRQYQKDRQSMKNIFQKKDDYFQKVFQNERRLDPDQLTPQVVRDQIAVEEAIAQTLRQKYDQLNTDLKTYDESESELFREVETRTRAVYDALQEVSNCSRVRVEGKATPRKLLRIDLPQTDENASVRLRQYLTQAISELAEAKKGNDEKKYQSMLETKLDSRNLLDIWINQTKIPVKVYKFEKITENSRLMEWDKACRSNSGGEHSLSCFIVISSLMAYIRNDHQEFEDESGIRKSETIICDNPFASVSSEHLVRPLIDIVKALNIQLITFTHINSASIANFFDVVIQLRNIRNAGNSTRLSIADESVSSEITDMESASLFRESVQQSLF